MGKSFQLLALSALGVILVIGLAGCGGRQSQLLQRIALLAPFEGRYSEIGYDAYYAARLALTDAENLDVELLAVDDGGSVASAVERAKALSNDPLIQAVIALGANAVSSETQLALADVPMVAVGYWPSKPDTSTVFVLTSAELSSVLNSPSPLNSITDITQIDYPAVGSDIFALKQFTLLNPEYRRMTIASSGSLPDEPFRTRFVGSGQYVAEPGLLATLTYDAVGMVLQAMRQDDVASALSNQSYKGLNGTIRFEKGYWVDAPIHYFGYGDNGQLVTIDRPVK